MPSGFVYVLQADNGLCKIGRSIDPDKRLKQFSGLPFHVKLVHRFEAYEHAEYWEKWVHRKYRHARVHGEWFKLTPSEILTIRSIVDTIGMQDFVFECAICRQPNGRKAECEICADYLESIFLCEYSPT